MAEKLRRYEKIDFLGEGQVNCLNTKLFFFRNNIIFINYFPFENLLSTPVFHFY